MVSTMHYVAPSACILDFYRLVLRWRKSHAIRILKIKVPINNKFSRGQFSSFLLYIRVQHVNKVIVSYSGYSCRLASIPVILQQVVGWGLLC